MSIYGDDIIPYVYSPFRYPGGKSQLYNFVNYTLKTNNINGTYIEPFAGGAGLAIKLLIKNRVKKIWINDYNKSIYSVWHAILTEPNKLIMLIKKVPFDYRLGSKESKDKDIRYWNKIKKIYLANKCYQNSLLNAFSTLLLNRMNVSGIISGGPIGGQKQNSSNRLYARFNKRTLISKIKKINFYKNRIKLTRLNALNFIPKIHKYSDLSNTFVFIDPPYFKQGKNLYMSFFTTKDHLCLSKLILKQKQMKWITTYDNSSEILKIFSKSPQKFRYLISYTANNKNRGKFYELMFANSNLEINSHDNVYLSRI